MSIILTKNELARRMVEEKRGLMSGVYYGRPTESEPQLFAGDNQTPVVNNKGEALQSLIVPKSTVWENTEDYARLWSEVEDCRNRLKRSSFGRAMNVAQFPDDYYTMIDRIRIDITRRRVENMDFTSEIAQEITNANFSKSVRLDEFLPYTGAFAQMTGRGESVPLIQQKTGGDGAVSILLYGLGWERSLEDELYNIDIFSLQKVNIAVARAYTALRNSLNGIGQAIALSIAGSWPLSQRVAASIGYATYDLNLYNTLRNAERKLCALLDPQTLQEIDVSRMVLLVRENNMLKDLQRVVGGRLTTMPGGGAGASYASSISLEPLGIDEIWQYKGDTLYVGTDRIDYPGVPAGHAYLFIPARGTNAPNYILNKRGLTQEVGRGDVLSLSREKRAWYCAQTGYSNEWFGEAAGGTAGTGFIVEITLPTFDEET